MAVSTYLKASVCLTILILLTTSTHADVAYACKRACHGAEGQAFLVCFFKCKEIVSALDEVRMEDQTPTENDEEYEEPTEGLRSAEEAVRVSRPLEVVLRNDRALRRANLLLNRFVRYGRSQPAESLRKTGQRRPNYVRVGRSDELNDYEDASKRASRFVRIGKSYEADARDGGALHDMGFSASQYEVDKKNKRPSKYVRIGKRGDETAVESGRQTAEA